MLGDIGFAGVRRGARAGRSREGGVFVDVLRIGWEWICGSHGVLWWGVGRCIFLEREFGGEKRGLGGFPPSVFVSV